MGRLDARRGGGPRSAAGIAAPLALLALAAGCAALAPSPGPAPVVRGPIASRAEHPLALAFLGFRPRRAATQAAGTLGLGFESAYASQFQDGASPTSSVLVDGETWHGALRGRFGLDERTDLEVELGLLYAWHGVLDGFVQAWHDLFQLPNGGREDRPRDAYAMDVFANGREAWSLDEQRLGLLDVPIVLTRVLARDEEGEDVLAARAGVELPLGDEGGGFGNGRLDWGAGLIGETTRGRFTGTLALDAVLTGGLGSFEAAGAEIESVYDAQLGVELRWNDRVSLLGSLVWTSPFASGVGLDEIESSIVDLGLGAAFDLGERSRLRLSFHEDLATATGPDFVVLLGLSWGM